MIRLLVTLSLVLSACEYVEMALPTSREETATPANPVASNTINAIQDSIVGMKRPTRTTWHSLASARIHAGAPVLTGYWVQLTTGGISTVVHLGLGLAVGDRITEIKVNLRNLAAGVGQTVTVNFVRTSAAGVNTTIGQIVHVNTGTDLDQLLTDTLASPETVEEGEHFWFSIGASAGDYGIWAVATVDDRL